MLQQKREREQLENFSTCGFPKKSDLSRLGLQFCLDWVSAGFGWAVLGIELGWAVSGSIELCWVVWGSVCLGFVGLSWVGSFGFN